MSFDKIKPYIAAIAASVTIYVITVLYVIFIAPALLVAIGRNGYNPLGALLCFIIDFVVQFAVIVVPAAVLAKKFNITAKCIPVTVVSLFCIFAIYIPPWRYLFILTSEWGPGMLVKAAGMSSVTASLFITVQYTLVMLFTVCIVQKHQKKISNKQKI